MNINLNVIYTSTVILSLFATTLGSSNENNIEDSHCSIEELECSQSTKTSSHKYDQNANEKASWAKFLDEYENAGEKYAASKRVSNKFPYTPVIDQDLKLFKKNGISREMLDKCRLEDKHSVTYQSIGGKIYRSKKCLFPARCEGIEYFLVRAIKAKNNISDFELVLNVHDWPISNKRLGTAVPTFSFSKTKDYADIFFPAWTFWAGGPAITLHPKGLGKWDEMRGVIIEAGKRTPWSAKRDLAFFRGSRTSSERDALVLLSRTNPEMVDAKYTKNQSWRSNKDTLGESPAAEVRLEDHCIYKYLFNYRGVAASFRFKHLFLCGSTVLHVGSQWKEFFYDSLIPWFHYVPITDKGNNGDDLKDVLEFLGAHSEVSKTIAQNGKEFIENHLRIRDVHRYWQKLLKKYSKMLDFKPVLNSDFIEING